MKRITSYCIKGYRPNDNTIWCKYTTAATTVKGARARIATLRKLGYTEFEVWRLTYLRYNTDFVSSEYSYKVIKF